MIKPVTAEDIRNMASVELGESFFAEGSLPGGIKPDVFRHNWEVLITQNIGAMWWLILDGKIRGAIGALYTADVNDGERIATEMFWYVHPDYRNGTWGIKLYMTFEKWAIGTMKVKRIIMVHLLNGMSDRLRSFFERKGYKAHEISYVKELWPSPLPQP